MRATVKSLAIVLIPAVVLCCTSAIQGASIAGVNFSNAANGFDISPDDLNIGDGITVTAWSFANGGGISQDGNSDAGRASAPVGKMNGQDGGAQPSVGAAAPVNNVHSFSINIPNGVFYDLTDVSFNFSQATGADAGRWLAFKTSLDGNLIFSQVGTVRPAFTPVNIALVGPQYKGLTNQVVTFQWYAGGGGSGDIDIDSILIGAQLAVPEPHSFVLWSFIGLGFAVAGYRQLRRAK